MATALTPALLVELRHAAITIRDALTGDRPANPAAIEAAHDTLEQRRQETSSAIRDAIDHYLNQDTWHQGPHTLRRAALHLVHTLGIATPEPPNASYEQLRLFQPPEE
jgi:hypothetical protein